MIIFQRYATKHKCSFNVYYNMTLDHYYILVGYGLTLYELQSRVYDTENEARQAIIEWDNQDL